MVAFGTLGDIVAFDHVRHLSVDEHVFGFVVSWDPIAEEVADYECSSPKGSGSGFNVVGRADLIREAKNYLCGRYHGDEEGFVIDVGGVGCDLFLSKTMHLGR